MKKITLLLLTCLFFTVGFTQVQKGSDIDGEAVFDFSGSSVSMPDTNTVAIGAIGNDGNGSNAGHVRIYSWNGTAWAQKGSDINGEAANDFSGSVSMPDANTVAIGATGNDGNGTNSGHVRIYSWNGTAWAQKGSDIDGEAAGDQSGSSVSMPDANTVAIGARNNDGNGTDAGHVRIYSWNGTAWTQKGSDIDGEAAGDFSGSSVSMPDANTVAIGATGNDGNGSDAGHVRIYSWNGTAWTQKGSDMDGEAAGDFSGSSVSMPDANTVAIGAISNDGNGSDAGHVRIYSWNGTAWTQKGSDIDGEAANDFSGYSVSMPDANTVAIGAYGNDGNGLTAGHVRIYSWNGTAWTLKGSDMDGEAAGDQSGSSVSMPDANTVAIGASFNGGNGSNAGSVSIFQYCLTTGTETVTACDSYVFNGITYTTSNNTAKDTLTNAAGCDSIVTLNLTINSLNALMLNVSEDTLTIVRQAGTTYQWIDCADSSIITGATDTIYRATVNGNYAVVATNGACKDTSTCGNVNTIGINDQQMLTNSYQLSPNPTTAKVKITNFKTSISTITILDATGKMIDLFQPTTAIIDLSNYNKGMYFIKIQDGENSTTKKVIKQ